MKLHHRQTGLGSLWSGSIRRRMKTGACTGC